MKTMQALIKREFFEGYNGYFWTPVVLLAVTLTVALAAALGIKGGIIHIDDIIIQNISNLSEALERAKAEEGTELPYAIAMAYTSLSMPAWIAFPFVVFFSLLDSLYEERRDRSILFWKSMPVADWQEVLAKLVMPVLGAPVIFMAVTIVAQLSIAVILSVIVLFQGGPVTELWPLGVLVSGWAGSLASYLIYALWAAPVLCWILLVSAYARRMPFLLAILPPVVLIVVEEIFFSSSRFANWLGYHLGGWAKDSFFADRDISGPLDLHHNMVDSTWKSFTGSAVQGEFWFGLVVAAAFYFGAVELRKRAL